MLFKILFFVTAAVVSHVAGETADDCYTNTDCAANTVATNKTCCTYKDGYTGTLGICSDKTLIGKGVDYCLAATENVCTKCTTT
jgi:hypothetical protein